MLCFLDFYIYSCLWAVFVCTGILRHCLYIGVCKPDFILFIKITTLSGEKKNPIFSDEAELGTD